ncbi:MAG TPA: hypothetical protein VGI19_02630, partial [Candidatus Cybelea sp.]
MKRFILPFVASFVALAGAGCAGTQSQSGGPAAAPAGTRVLPPAVVRQLSLSMAHYVELPVHQDRRRSYMQPDAGKRSGLIYAGDNATNDVDVYDYASHKQVGTLTGFNEPYGMCVDAKGDIYITNFAAGNAVEYAHGGSSPLNTYVTPGGEPI